MTTPEVPATDPVVTRSAAPGTTGLRWALVLGSLTLFGPLSLDLYLPAFPQIAADYGTSPSRVQLTLTACLVGLAVGQLVDLLRLGDRGVGADRGSRPHHPGAQGILRG